MTDRKHPIWRDELAKHLGLEVREVKSIAPSYRQYEVIAPTGMTLFAVGSYVDQDHITSTDGPWCNWPQYGG